LEAILLDFAQEGGLEAAEREIVRAFEPCAWERKTPGIATLGGMLDGRPAGIAEAEYAGGLVECFARGVVYSLAEKAILAVSCHKDKLGMAARYYETEGREARLCGYLARGGLGFGDEPVGVDMSFDVVDGDERFATCERYGLGCVYAHEEGRREAGTPCYADRIDVYPGHTGAGESFFKDGDDRYDVLTGRKLRHHAAVFLMEWDLRRDNVSYDMATVAHNGY
jgi:hypothetical protein